MSQLKQFYDKEVVPQLVEAFKYKNRMQVPKLEKIILNMGLGEAIQNIKIIDSAVEELGAISGQKPWYSPRAGCPTRKPAVPATATPGRKRPVIGSYRRCRPWCRSG